MRSAYGLQCVERACNEQRNAFLVGCDGGLWQRNNRLRGAALRIQRRQNVGKLDSTHDDDGNVSVGCAAHDGGQLLQIPRPHAGRSRRVLLFRMERIDEHAAA